MRMTFSLTGYTRVDFAQKDYETYLFDFLNECGLNHDEQNNLWDDDLLFFNHVSTLRGHEIDHNLELHPNVERCFNAQITFSKLLKTPTSAV
jgi:hypothetical protein